MHPDPSTTQLSTHRDLVKVGILSMTICRAGPSHPLLSRSLQRDLDIKLSQYLELRGVAVANDQLQAVHSMSDEWYRS